MSRIGYLIKEGFKNIFHHRLMTLASIGVLSSCLVLTGAAVMLTVNMTSVVESVGDKNVTKVFLDENLTKLQAVRVGKEIEKLDNITKAEFVDKEDAIQTYRQQISDDQLFEELTGEGNPLPYVYNVTMTDLELYDDTVTQLKQVQGVASISSHREVAEKLTSLQTFITTASLWIILALAVISLFIISNTIRMTMFSHRFEISIMKSVGATNAFVRVPFIVEGIIIGLVSAGISIGLLYLLTDGAINYLKQILDFNYVPFKEVMWYIIIAFVGAGVLVGSLGSMISIRRYLRHEGNEILGW